MNTRWPKSYVIYVAVVAPFMVLTLLFVHQRGISAVLYGVIVFAGLMVKDRIQRKVWP